MPEKNKMIPGNIEMLQGENVVAAISCNTPVAKMIKYNDDFCM
jgi:hypothetical protein